ncbi:hypothetical protein ACOSP7_031770 [Xanthoceras sorbifolium]
MAGLRSSSYGNNNTDSSIINQKGEAEAGAMEEEEELCVSFVGELVITQPSIIIGLIKISKAIDQILLILEAIKVKAEAPMLGIQFKASFRILFQAIIFLKTDTPTCNIAQTVQAVSCNTGSHRYTNIDSVATHSQVSAVTSSSKVQGLYNEQAEQCYTRRDDTKYHKSDRRMVAADVQVEAADTSWSKCVASHDCRFSSPG